MKVYISGKVTGTTDYMTRFGDAEARLIQKGYTVLNPVAVTQNLPQDTTWQGYMAIALAMLLQADAIYMLSGWETSKGAAVERAVADSLGLLVTFENSGR